MVKNCEALQNSLQEFFWDVDTSTFVNHYPVNENEDWRYWWHAHGLDALLDRYLRNKSPELLEHIRANIAGIRKLNGDTFLHNWYDDMEWMALTLLRVYDATGEDYFKEEVNILWQDIKTAWNDNMGGGMAWKKDQLDYKNTPANGPAAILAYRLYIRFKNPEDLEWGRKILKWNYENLVDPETLFVWDGVNRLGDGKIDYEWEFSYCQGVIIGALVEEYKVSGEKKALETAVKIAEEANRRLTDSKGILRHEGPDDCGLFKGIYVRYLYELIEVCNQEKTEQKFKEFMINNANSIIENACNKNCLVGGSWQNPEDGTIDLAQHLSAVMVLEMSARCVL